MVLPTYGVKSCVTRRGLSSSVCGHSIKTVMTDGVRVTDGLDGQGGCGRKVPRRYVRTSLGPGTTVELYLVS